MIRTYDGHTPRLHATAFVHDSAEVIGKVTLGARVSIWPLASVRGDVDRIMIGPGTNVQDCTVIHTRDDSPTMLGKDVTVGHGVILHGCRIGDRTLVGMGAIVLEASIGSDCLIAAGSLVLAGLRVPPRSVVMGSPAKVVRPIKPAELKHIRDGQRWYLRRMEIHRRTSRPVFRG